MTERSQIVNPNNQTLRKIVLLADESAAWRVAGLSQLDRIILALNDYAARAQEADKLSVHVSWLETAESGDSGSLLQDRQFPHLSFVEGFGQGDAVLVMSTRLVVDRDSFRQLLQGCDANGERPALVLSGTEPPHARIDRVRAAELKACSQGGEIGGNSDWRCVRDRSEISACEKWLLRRTRKSQDGFIARFINRPISRSVSRQLLRFPLRPNHWTLLLTAIPIVGSFFLLQGTYLGFALGAVIFQLHSALDGCDGEIARVKYLESGSGRKLDEVCDRFATLLYAVSLGLGLAHQAGISELMRWVYTWEGIGAAVLIGISETLLTRTALDRDPEIGMGDDLYRGYFKENRDRFNQGDHLKLWMIKNSRMLLLGDSATSFFSDMTKRDVFNFGFMLLAICGLPAWILHILAVSAVAITLVAFKNLLRPVLRANRARIL